MEEFHKEIRRCRRAAGVVPQGGHWVSPESRWKKMTATMHWYPRCPDLRRALGLSAHSDSGFCSRASCQGCSCSGGDQTGGWQCRRSFLAPSSSTSATSSICMLTNGRFHSVYHRAVVNRNRDRISLGYFLGLPAERQGCRRPCAARLERRLPRRHVAGVQGRPQEGLHHRRLHPRDGLHPHRH
ncbi:Os05g0257800 [Oryza sativa Japonica Group]|uniref:Os05g0257800 protein n=1 Tax=Oryza sativa subsp. japonica TaxID=39947 RepID=A0A0P0WJV5_ORYSJ|nr:Os05g0257800 [Oryza sativa Japonica Group]